MKMKDKVAESKRKEGIETIITRIVLLIGIAIAAWFAWQGDSHNFRKLAWALIVIDIILGVFTVWWLVSAWVCRFDKY